MHSGIVLVCWNAEEAETRSAGLRKSGFEVTVHADRRANPQEIAASPPDAYLIDLGRSPSQGRELGGWLRRNRDTRSVPLVFIAGDREKTEKARALLPDATFTTWEDAPGDIARAIAAPPTDPVVPGAMDAYAGAPLFKKLGIREGVRVVLLGADSGFEDQLRALPKGARVTRDATVAGDVLLLFAHSAEDLEASFRPASARLAEGGRLWICWPKKRSGVPSDLTQRAVRAYGLARGFVDYKIASIDEIWSGLCFARRDRSHVGR